MRHTTGEWGNLLSHPIAFWMPLRCEEPDLLQQLPIVLCMALRCDEPDLHRDWLKELPVVHCMAPRCKEPGQFGMFLGRRDQFMLS